jgi:hypothetical protein
MSRRNLRCDTFTVPPDCVVAAPELGLSPVGLPPDPAFPEVGTFLSSAPLPARTTVSCPPPPSGGATQRWAKVLWRGGSAHNGKSLSRVAPCVSRSAESTASAGSPPGNGSHPALMPCVMLRRGRVCRPGPDGPVPSRTAQGTDVDAFDVLDALAPQYRSVYLVDLDGLERNVPQLEYIQELSRDTTLWVDAGVRRADGAIDILVAGAERAVLSSSYLQGPRELKRAWKLSTEIVFEVELSDGIASPADPGWGSADAVALAASARAAGPDTVILSPRGADPDWDLVSAVAAHGPTWVDGTFTRGNDRSLAAANAAGGIFHIEDVLDALQAG